VVACRALGLAGGRDRLCTALAVAAAVLDHWEGFFLLGTVLIARVRLLARWAGFEMPSLPDIGD